MRITNNLIIQGMCKESIELAEKEVRNTYGLNIKMTIIMEVKSQGSSEYNRSCKKNWIEVEDWFSCEFLCEYPGEFEAALTICTGFHGVWDFGHKAVLQYNGQENEFVIADMGLPTASYQKRTFQAGKIKIDSAGLQKIAVKALQLSGKTDRDCNCHP